jgi:intracellular septation protein
MALAGAMARRYNPQVLMTAKLNPLLKLALEFGPLAIFFAANSARGIYVGTGAFMAATLVALAISYAITRTIPVMPLVTAIFVVVFGGLTLLLANELFIKIKPTIVNLAFAGILLFGLRTGRLFIKLVLGSAVHLTEQGWLILTRAWIGFFIVLAALNEVIWRSTTTDTWVAFKVFGIMPLTILFSLSMVPVMMRHSLPMEENSESDGPVDSP